MSLGRFLFANNTMCILCANQKLIQSDTRLINQCLVTLYQPDLQGIDTEWQVTRHWSSQCRSASANLPDTESLCQSDNWLDQCLAINVGPTSDLFSINSSLVLLSDELNGQIQLIDLFNPFSNLKRFSWQIGQRIQLIIWSKVWEFSSSTKSRLSSKPVSWSYCKNIGGIQNGR